MILVWTSENVLLPGDSPLRAAARHRPHLLLRGEEGPAVAGGGVRQAGAVEEGVGAGGRGGQAEVLQAGHQLGHLLPTGQVQVEGPQVFVLECESVGPVRDSSSIIILSS